MRQGTIAAIAVAALLVLVGCTGGDGPPSGERNTPTAVGSESPEPTEAGPTDPDPTTEPTTDPTETAPAPDPEDPTDPDEQALLDLVRAEGTVSVIVEAALDGEAERGSDEHERLVAEALDVLEAELDPEHTTVTTRFELDPRLTLTVDEGGLRALFASPRVTHVWENESFPLE